MPVDIKLIALDLDGTLLEDDHRTMPRKNRDALRAAAARGVHIVLASGRARCMMEEHAQALGCVRYLVTACGAVTLDRAAGAELDRRSIPAAVSGRLLREIDGLNLPMEIYAEDRIYVARRFFDQPQGRPAEYVRLRETLATAVEDLPEALAGKCVDKADLDGVEPEPLARLQSIVDRTEGVEVSFSHEGAELFARGVNKGAALRTLCARLGIGAEEVMAFGDGDNDKEMLSWAGWSFAMESGGASAKASARFLAPANGQAGVGEMVARYVLA